MPFRLQDRYVHMDWKTSCTLILEVIEANGNEGDLALYESRVDWEKERLRDYIFEVPSPVCLSAIRRGSVQW